MSIIMKGVITITFGGMVENHAGNQQIGKIAEKGDGFSSNNLNEISEKLNASGIICEIINIKDNIPNGIDVEDASILIIRNGVNLLLGNGTADKFYKELINDEITWDSNAFMYGRVVNKHARHNLCFADFSQEPDYENKKGRVIDFKNMPCLSGLRNINGDIFGLKGKNLLAEGNYYYDIKNTGIGWHGDAERRKVIAVRLGNEFPLYYQWFLNSKPIGDRIKINLNHGDIYIMSEKAVGTDWKTRSIPTLRHSAGADKYQKIKIRKVKTGFNSKTVLILKALLKENNLKVSGRKKDLIDRLRNANVKEF